MKRERGVSSQKTGAVIWLVLASLCLPSLKAQPKKKGEEPKPEKAIQAILVSGGASHDYSVRKDIITRGISERVSQKIEWMVHFQGDRESDAKIPVFESESWAEGYDIVVHDHCFPRVRDTDYVDRILSPHEGGTPAVLIHGTMHSFRTGDNRWFDFCGVTSRRHDENKPLTITPKTPLNPIWGGLDTWMTPAGQLYLIDELSENTEVLGTALAQGGEKKHAVVWQHRYGPAKARVFGMTPGNDLNTLVQPEFLDVFARGFLWALDKAGEEEFKAVAPESSLSGFVLPVATRDLPAVGGRALGFSSVSISMPGEMVAASPFNGMLAVDRESGTTWIPEKRGPVAWQGEMHDTTPVSALAIVWDNPPALYSLSTSVDGFSWDAIGENVFEGKALTALHEMPKRLARWVRVDLLQSGGTTPSGIRELGVYATGSDLPAGFRVQNLSLELSDSKRGVILSLDDDRVGNDFLLHRDWRLSAVSSLPRDVVVKSIATTAADSAFLLVSSASREDAALRVLHFKREGGEVKVSTFLDGLAPESIIGWDGEWLFVFDGSSMGQYRGTGDEDGAADERHLLGTLFSDGISGEDAPVNRAFHEMVVAPDGWIYASFSQEGGSEAFSRAGKSLVLPEHGILRFTRELGDPELVVRSKSKIKAFIVDQQSIKLVSGAPFHGLYELPPLAEGLFGLQPLSEVIPDALLRGAREKSWIEIADSSISEVVSDGEVLNRRTIASLPGILHFSLDGLNNGWFVRRVKGERSLQLGLISKDEVTSEIELNRVSAERLIHFLGEGTNRQKEAAFLELLRRKRIPLSDIEAVLNAPEKDATERGFALRLLVAADEKNALNHLTKWSDSEEPKLRRLAFDLLGNIGGAANHEVFSRISEETDPSVTAAILSGIFRSGSDAPALDRLVLKLAATPEPKVANAALAFLIRRGAMAACFEALDDPEQRDLWAAGFKVLSQIHRQTVVDRLGEQLARTADPEFRALNLSALCQLYTSPSGGGWEGSGFVGSLLRASLSDRRVDKARLLDQMIAHQIPFQVSSLVSLARDDLSLEPFVVDRLMTDQVLPELGPWLKAITKSDSRDPVLRRKALIALAGIEESETFLSLFEPVANALSEEAWIGDNRGLLERRWRENPVRSEVAGELIEKTKGRVLSESRLAWEPLLLMRDDFKGGKSAALAVVARIDEILSAKEEEEIKPMLLAMKRVSSLELPRALAVIGSGADESIKRFVKESGINEIALTTWSPSLTDFGIKKFLAEARSKTGGSKAGYDWFKRRGCSACHNIHGEGPSLGPNFSFQTEGSDFESLFESVTDPTAKVTDSAVLHTFEMKEGTRVIGADVIRKSGRISLIDTAGNRISVAASEVHREWVQGESLMPRLAPEAMTSQDFADLKAFLDSLVGPGLTTSAVN